MTKAKQPSISLTVAQLHKKLQPIFNKWVRLRDTFEDASGRWGICISCNKYCAFAELQAGHFIPEHKAVHRYNPKNVNAQCVRCNLYLKSNPLGYMLGLKKKYSAQTVWFLLKTKDDKAGYTVEQLLDMITMYKKKVKGLET